MSTGGRLPSSPCPPVPPWSASLWVCLETLTVPRGRLQLIEIPDSEWKTKDPAIWTRDDIREGRRTKRQPLWGGSRAALRPPTGQSRRETWWSAAESGAQRQAANTSCWARSGSGAG